MLRVPFGVASNSIEKLVNDYNKHCSSLPLDEAIASKAVIVIVSGSDGRTEMFLQPAE